MPLLPSPWHSKLAMTSWFWQPFRPTHANCHAFANRAWTALSANARWLARVGQNDRRKTSPRAVMRGRRAPPPLSCRLQIFISLKILVILMRGSTILLIYIKSGLPAIFEAVVAVFRPRWCVPWPKILCNHQWCARLLLSPSTCRLGALASLRCHSPTFVLLLHPFFLRACLFLVGCCVSLLFHRPPKSTDTLCIFFLFFTLSPQKRIVSAFPCAPHSSRPPSVVPLSPWVVGAAAILTEREGKAAGG